MKTRAFLHADYTQETKQIVQMLMEKTDKRLNTFSFLQNVYVVSIL